MPLWSCQIPLLWVSPLLSSLTGYLPHFLLLLFGLFLQLHHFVQNVTANLFFTTPVCLLICQIPCDLFTLPATSLNKFMETMLLRVGFLPSPPRRWNGCSSSFSSTCRVQSLLIELHTIVPLHRRLQSALAYNADSLDPALRFWFRRLGCSPETGICAQSSRVPEASGLSITLWETALRIPLCPGSSACV